MIKLITYCFDLAIKSAPLQLICFIISTFLSLFLPILSMLNTQNIINLLQTGSGFDNKKLLFSIIFFPIITIITQVVLSIQGYSTTRLKDIMDFKISLKSLTIISKEPLSSFEDPNFYDAMQRAEQSGGTHPFSITVGTISLISQMFSLLSYIFILISWKWWTLLVIAIFPLLSSLQISRINRSEYEIFKKRTNLERKSWYYANLLNKDENIKETKLYGLEEKFLSKFVKMREKFLEENRSLLLRRSMYSLIINFISIISTSIVLVMVFYEASLGIIMLGSLMTYINSIGSIKTSFNTIIELIFKLHQDSLYLENLIAILSLEKKQVLECSEKRGIKITSIQSIELKDVSFQYSRSKKKALDRVSMKFETGNTYALVGQNGSGKTTLIKILMGFYPKEYSGEILINGYNFSDIDIASYKKCLSAVFQDFTKYQFSVDEVISMTEHENMPVESVIQASIDADAHEFIEKLPNGYYQQLGNWFPGGIQLSGGEWQKISIAKSFFKRNADLFIFDEPSSALDPVSESKLYEKFNHLTKHKLGIFITHRMNNVRFNGIIIVMENGKVSESGFYDELMKNKQLFYKLKTASNVID
ncbi:ABC transporter ATP-binding protein [Vagococcus fluvialis]|uniref:ABC transporter ATP-binding protein n=1 Tax=Vagococcus fluvialis TaxID=2738 RepID=UPI001A8DA047|nr:ABC transporter ATP-binding protein [Vagococcus fluvialis]MBO0444266.1 ABC transporter ATP-binding protein [Vagococcus fluvialis]